MYTNYTHTKKKSFCCTPEDTIGKTAAPPSSNELPTAGDDP
jgi:hypothetical protein